MVKVIQDFIGKERKPFLVMDIDPRSASRKLLGSPFCCGNRIFEFCQQSRLFLKADQNNVSYFDIEDMQRYVAEISADQPVVVFGFTYILYSNVLKSLQNQHIKKATY